jgi:sulfopyruvate decarboxylase TPP-binding subunit
MSEALAKEFVDLLMAKGFDFFAGVPCSLLDGLIREAESRGRYIAAVREDAAIGLAAGAYFAGKRPAVLMQNSGLGYCLNALTSLNLIYKILGEIHPKLLETCGVPHQVLEEGRWAEQVAWAADVYERQRIPVCLEIRKGPFHRPE